MDLEMQNSFKAVPRGQQYALSLDLSSPKIGLTAKDSG